VSMRRVSSRVNSMSPWMGSRRTVTGAGARFLRSRRASAQRQDREFYRQAQHDRHNAEPSQRIRAAKKEGRRDPAPTTHNQERAPPGTRARSIPFSFVPHGPHGSRATRRNLPHKNDRGRRCVTARTRIALSARRHRQLRGPASGLRVASQSWISAP
jgi:hypothetical protein